MCCCVLLLYSLLAYTTILLTILQMKADAATLALVLDRLSPGLSTKVREYVLLQSGQVIYSTCPEIKGDAPEANQLFDAGLCCCYTPAAIVLCIRSSMWHTAENEATRATRTISTGINFYAAGALGGKVQPVLDKYAKSASSKISVVGVYAPGRSGVFKLDVMVTVEGELKAIAADVRVRRHVSPVLRVCTDLIVSVCLHPSLSVCLLGRWRLHSPHGRSDRTQIQDQHRYLVDSTSVGHWRLHGGAETGRRSEFGSDSGCRPRYHLTLSNAISSTDH